MTRPKKMVCRFCGAATPARWIRFIEGDVCICISCQEQDVYYLLLDGVRWRDALWAIQGSVQACEMGLISAQDAIKAVSDLVSAALARDPDDDDEDDNDEDDEDDEDDE